jgi:uncharacterized membrane protein YedE/YeeE
MYAVYSFVAGLVLGIGLIVSGMSSPSKVLAFLDLAGKWDPSLAMLLAGAVAVGFVSFQIGGKRKQTLIGSPMHLPQVRDVDLRLVAGSLVFGLGWGLAGLSPGNALVVLGQGHVKAFIFVVAMVVGMGVFELFEHRRTIKSRTHDSHPAPGTRHGSHRKAHPPVRREHG